MSTRREQLGTAILVAGLVLAFFAAVHLPGRGARVELHRDIASAEAEIARRHILLEEYRTIQADLARHDDFVVRSSTVFSGPHEVLADVHRIAVDSRMKVVRLEPEARRRRSSYVECPFRLEFRGNFGTVASFLRGLERHQRVYAVEELEIQPLGGGANQVELEGVFRFAVFAEHDVDEKLSKEVRDLGRL